MSSFYDLYINFCFDGFMQKREKRRWIFRKTVNQETVTQQTPTKETTAVDGISSSSGAGLVDQATAAVEEKRHAMAVDVAAAAAAEAARASAQAAAEVARLIRPPTFSAREIYAAIVIQTAFRGYLVSKSVEELNCLISRSLELIKDELMVFIFIKSSTWLDYLFEYDLINFV